ncbi:hypothetical protein LptCag_1871 [Leptospirillum ferriphilum]|uniref:Uncharacterized protein n=1 Tax=Leptospirillum ferriphilum TaxID=178606 RepID=A0A094YJ00_9BACT|nr:hypothetical protein LptCag_1871 [Leptospirillum ferriphilum]
MLRKGEEIWCYFVHPILSSSGAGVNARNIRFRALNGGHDPERRASR